MTCLTVECNASHCCRCCCKAPDVICCCGPCIVLLVLGLHANISFTAAGVAADDDQLVGENGEILQGHRDMGKSSPMSEDKKAQTPEQG